MLRLHADGALDVVLSQQFLTFAWCELDQAVGGIEAVPADLRDDGVAIGGKGASFDQDAPACALRTVEGGEQHVQVHGERVHRDDFVPVRARQCCEARSQQRCVVDPGPASGELPADAAPFPAVELLIHDLACCEGHQAERVAAKVDERPACSVARQSEAGAEFLQGIRAIVAHGSNL